MTLGLRPRAIMAALRPIPGPYNYKRSLTYNYAHHFLVEGGKHLYTITSLDVLNIFLVSDYSADYYGNSQNSCR